MDFDRQAFTLIFMVIPVVILIFMVIPLDFLRLIVLLILLMHLIHSFSTTLHLNYQTFYHILHQIPILALIRLLHV